MDLVCSELASQFVDITFVKIEAENCPKISSKFDIEVVPTFIFLHENGKEAGRVEGANPAEVSSLCKSLSENVKISSDGASDTPISLEERMEKLINASPVMLFMKGNVSAPKCKFSRQV